MGIKLDESQDEFTYLTGKDVWPLMIKVYINPKLWLAYAHSLKNSADVIFNENILAFNQDNPKYIQVNVSKMLYGFSLENLIKAVIISSDSNPSRFFQDGKLQFIKNHNLIQLIEQTKYKPKEEENDLLELLTICSTWAGRYPIPVNAKNLPDQRKGEPDLESLQRKISKNMKNINHKISRIKLIYGIEYILD